MFKKDACDLCGDCLVKCQWMEVEKDQAKDWIQQMIHGEKTPVIEQCINGYRRD